MARETEVGPRGKKAPKELSRREFVKGAAVGAVAVAGAGALASCAAPTPEVIKETVEVPVEVTKIVEVPVPGEAGESVYEVFPPYGVPTTEAWQPVARLDTLEGKTICGIGDSFHFPETWLVMVELLKKKYPTAKFVGPDIFNEIAGGEQVVYADLPAALEQYKCDAIIVGNGC